jgi:hypothetical protein
VPIAVSVIATMNSLVSFLSLDRVYLWSQFAVYIFGGIALITGKIVNDRQAFQIERLRKANLTLEAAISDRTFKDQGGAASRLKQFAPSKVAIPYIQTDEALSTARQIAWVLWTAGWSLQPRANVSRKQPFLAREFSWAVRTTLYLPCVKRLLTN